MFFKLVTLGQPTIHKMLRALTKRVPTVLRQYHVTQTLRTDALEWRESVLGDGTVLYRHPSYEQILAVKQQRVATARAQQKSKHLPQTLTAEQITKARALHEEDPERYTTPRLAKLFNVNPEYVVQAVQNLVLQSSTVYEHKKKELRDLKIANKKKPHRSRHSSKFFHIILTNIRTRNTCIKVYKSLYFSPALTNASMIPSSLHE